MLKYLQRGYVYNFGLRAHLPFDLLRKTADTIEQLPHLGERWERQRIAKDLLRDSKWRGFIPRDSGFRKFVSAEVPGLDRLIEIAREVHKEFSQGKRSGTEKPTNPFHTLLTRDDFEKYPELLATALSGPLVEAATGYFGSLPRLDNIDVWVAKPNLEDSGLYNSQLFHLDKVGDGYLSLFVNVSDVSAESGPLVVIPADASDRVRRNTQYERRAVFGDGRLSDEEIKATVGPDEYESLEGPAGTGIFVDNSRCLHAGSRCEAGERVTLTMSFVPWYRGVSRHVAKFANPPKAGRAVTRMLLKGSPAAQQQAWQGE